MTDCDKGIIIFYDSNDNYLGSLPTRDITILDIELETKEIDIKEKRYHSINKINEIEIRRTNE